LSCIYLSQGFVIYPHRQTITRGEETIQVRPKTFALLLLMLAKPREVLSKRYLLDSIWDDVTVEEQVLVQSIRELRQLFGSAEIIQTYPRKGYAWAADVEIQTAAYAPITANTPLVDTPKPTLWWRKAYAVPALAIAIVIALGGIFYALSARSSAVQTEVVIVLPVKNQIPSNDYNWIPLGAMDELIHLLGSNENVQVMSSEYVLSAMAHANLERNFQTQEVTRVFDVSGASLVVEAQIGGFAENYRIDYKLHFKQDIKRGVVFDRDLHQALYQLGEIIASHTGQPLHKPEEKAQTAFNNELFARALEKKDASEFELARTLFASLKQLEPNNMKVRTSLAQVLIRLNEFTAAKSEIESALELAQTTRAPERSELFFDLALIAKHQTQFAQALNHLNQAESFADETNSVLMHAEIADLRGEIHISNGAYTQAQTAFEQALKFNSVIRCPVGISDNHIKLAKLLVSQGKRESALEHYNQAKSVIETHHLDSLRTNLASFK
jgi:DNA-binding winged helix-turn-helix (wHTH) protein